jgi:hypothetical protein
VGYLIGFIEPACEYSTEYWKVLMTVRDEIRYNVAKNSTYVFVKTAYKNKLKYHFQQLKEFTQDITRVNPKLPIKVQETLVQKGFCTPALAIQMIVGKDKYVYLDVEYNFD